MPGERRIAYWDFNQASKVSLNLPSRSQSENIVLEMMVQWSKWVHIVTKRRLKEFTQRHEEYDRERWKDDPWY